MGLGTVEAETAGAKAGAEARGAEMVAAAFAIAAILALAS